jgi:hypothetical protein
MKEVLATYDRHREGLPERFQAIDHARWEKPVPFLFWQPGRHERNQLRKCVGLSSRHHPSPGTDLHVSAADGSTVPQIYGPSADEPM